ncbi:MAG: bacterial Ig-like domain-containing protein, partial [Clostridiales Family XIII bacterium]|jgi:uncharacterized protein YhfF|nr:bacterial Ig-like domain-containing protein [Clostridiales Family XIII bacterium]
MRLIDYFYEVGNTYGLEITITPRATEYFLSYLDTEPPEAVLESIEVTSQPAKTVYAIGDALDITGLEVTGHYSDGSSKALAVTEADVSGFDSTEAAEELVLTVSVGGKSATFTVSVEAGEPPEPPEAVLESIEVTSQPAKTAYVVGDALDITGLEVTGHYSDGSSKALAVTEADVSGFDSTAAAEGLVLTVSVGGKSATFTVSVEAGEPPEPPLGDFSVTADKARKLVSVSGTGYAPNQILQLRSAYNREPSAADSDYASEVRADADGNLEFTLPADATEGQPWLGGHSYYVSLGGVVESASIYATVAKVHTSTRATLKVKRELELAYTIDGVEYTFESSNQGIARVSQDGVVTGVRAGTAVITLRATDGSGLISTMMISVSM